MAGKITVNEIILGDSSTPANNFLLKTNQDGTATLARNADGSGGNILTVNADGGVKINTAPAFSAYQSIATSIPNNTVTKVFFQTEEFDTTNAYNSATNSRFQPTIAGYYQVNSNVVLTAPVANLFTSIFKNGIESKRGTQFSLTTNGAFGTSISALVFLNGTTDYIEISAYQTNTGSIAVNTNTGVYTYFQAFLARAV